MQASFAAAVGVVWWRGDDVVGRAALGLAAALLGAVLAVFGQAYQTGADPWQLFAVWAALLVPWALGARRAWPWLACVALCGAAAWLRAQRGSAGLAGLDTVPPGVWALFALNAVALAAWELAAGRLAWLRARWATRTLVLASVACAATLGAYGALDGTGPNNVATFAWLGWTGALWYGYRHVRRDAFALAAAALGAIGVLLAASIGPFFAALGPINASLGLGLLIVALAAGAARWLRHVDADARDRGDA